jgi:hypothetical protein
MAHKNSGCAHKTWWFPIVMLVYQRVNHPFWVSPWHPMISNQQSRTKSLQENLTWGSQIPAWHDVFFSEKWGLAEQTKVEYGWIIHIIYYVYIYNVDIRYICYILYYIYIVYSIYIYTYFLLLLSLLLLFIITVIISIIIIYYIILYYII